MEPKKYHAVVRAFGKYRFRAPLSRSFFRNDFLLHHNYFTVNEFVAAATFLCLQCEYKDYEFVRTVQIGTQVRWPLFSSEHFALLSMVLVAFTNSSQGSAFAAAFAD